MMKDTNIAVTHSELTQAPASGYGIWQLMTAARAYVDALPPERRCTRRGRSRIAQELDRRGLFDHHEDGYRERKVNSFYDPTNPFLRGDRFRYELTGGSLTDFYAAYQTEQRRRRLTPLWPDARRNGQITFSDC